MRVVGIFAMTVGAAMLVGVLPLFVYQQRLLRQDSARLESETHIVSAWNDSLTSVATGADSARLRGALRTRAGNVARLEAAVAARTRKLERWWSPTGGGMIIVAGGLILLAAGWSILWRAVTAPWNLPPLDERYRSQG